MKIFSTITLILLACVHGQHDAAAQTKFVPGNAAGAAPGQPGAFGAAQGRPGMPGALQPMLNFVPSMPIEMRPSEKRPLLLKESERNPYARRSVHRETENQRGENVEELQIREQLSNLSVTGSSYGQNGLRILLGDIILEKGRVVPQLIPDQTEHLQVIRVTKENILLGWLDIETHELTGKTVQISYDLSPSVSYALQGQGNIEEQDGPSRRVMGLLRHDDVQMRQIEGMASNASEEDEE